ncbi:deoxyribose mutarotase, partial [Salmonella enterica subsp. enterica serovar Mbandaka]
MTTRITLWRELFCEQPRIFLGKDDFLVTAVRFASGGGGMKKKKNRGHLGVFPWVGEMILGAAVYGHDLASVFFSHLPAPQ